MVTICIGHDNPPPTQLAMSSRHALNENGGVPADELLETLRAVCDCADLAYSEVPVRLGGGFVTENHAFLLADAPPPWNQQLVLRLFPTSAPADLARREATTQRVLCEQGYPAARVLFFHESARIDGRRFFVMERLAGRALMGGIRVRELGGSGLRLFWQLPDVTASVQASLHPLDAQPLVEAMGATAPP